MPYTQYFSALSSHLEKIVVIGGYPFLFLTVLLEGIPLVGTAVPGHVTIIAAGFLAKIGVFGLAPVLVLSLMAALIGDYIGYSLGRKYGLPLIDRFKPFFFITDEQVSKVQDLLRRHTGKAMILGRLSPMTRSLLPFFVGANHTPDRQFWTFNVIGGVIWVFLSVILGYAFGAGYQAVAGSLGKFILIAIILTLLILWGYRFINLRFHVFKRYELFALGLNLISLWALATTIQDAWAIRSFMSSFDIQVNIFMASHVTPFFASIASWVSLLGGTAVTGGLGIILGLLFAFRRKWRRAALALLSVVSTGLLLGVMKEFFMRARPDNALITIVGDPSFPSGHAAMAAAFFVILIYLIVPKIDSWIKRELSIVLCVAVAVAIGLSRLVLNVHWASDVIAGWALGVFCATASILVVRYAGAIVLGKGSAKPSTYLRCQ